MNKDIMQTFEFDGIVRLQVLLAHRSNAPLRSGMQETVCHATQPLPSLAATS